MSAIGSLCSGYGGLDMAADAVLGGELAWVADNDPGAAAILALRLPSVPNLGDITATDWSAVEPVDVLTAGFPCQDVSCAGARAGLREGNRTGVWAHVARAIAVLRPPLVLLENVRGLLSAGADSDMEPCPWCLGDAGDEHALRASGAVLGDLASLGYDARWAVVSAADAGAPHRRERVFIVAWPAADAAGDGWDEGRPEPAGIIGGSDAAQRGHGPDSALRDAANGRLQPVGSGGTDWGAYAAAVTRWEAITGRPAPQPTEPGRTGQRLAPRFVEWMMGLPDGWVTEAPGLSRNAQLKALGNGVVPQQAIFALRLLLSGVAAEAVS